MFEKSYGNPYDFLRITKILKKSYGTGRGVRARIFLERARVPVHPARAPRSSAVPKIQARALRART